jgi:hypothetical protein
VRRFDEAISACRDAAAIYRETGDLHGERMALKNLESARFAVVRLPEAGKREFGTAPDGRLLCQLGGGMVSSSTYARVWNAAVAVEE